MNTSKAHAYYTAEDAIRIAFGLGMSGAYPEGTSFEPMLAGLVREVNDAINGAISEARDRALAYGRIEGAVLAARLLDDAYEAVGDEGLQAQYE